MSHWHASEESVEYKKKVQTKFLNSIRTFFENLHVHYRLTLSCLVYSCTFKHIIEIHYRIRFNITNITFSCFF